MGVCDVPLEPRVFVALEDTVGSGEAQESPSCRAAPGVARLALRHQGQIRLGGPGTTVAFADGGNALRFAIALRDRPGGNGAGMRIGIHASAGDGAKAAAVASEIGRRMQPGGVVLSDAARACLPSEAEVPTAPIGLVSVDGFAAPVEAFRLESHSKTGVVGWEPRVLCFDIYEIDTARFELRRNGVRVPLEPRAFDLLLLLARNRQRTVTRDEIFGALWPDRIVSDAALSSQVKAVRQAIGDDGVAQHTIATVHGRGFRFVRPLEPRPSASGSVAVSAAAAPHRAIGRPVVAVLPLAAIGPEAALIADGITEDVITALAKHRWLGVVARSPCFAFRGASEPIGAIAEKLGAGYVVTGSVRREGSRVRTNVEIVDARTSHALWSERFDRELESIFDLQDDISAAVASRIAIELGIVEQHKAARRPLTGRGAWDLYHLGVAEFYRFTPASNRRAQEHLREAIRLAPDFAEPHARLAYAIVLEMVYFERPVDQDAMDEALALALRCLALDDQDAHGYFTLGRVRLARREYGLAIDALEQALALNPCLALSYCGLGDSLAYEGRLDEAIAQFETAIELSPHDPFRWAFFSYRSLAHLFRREFAEAAHWAGHAVQVPNAHYWAHAHLVSALGHHGDAAQTEAARVALLRFRPGFSRAFAGERLFFIKQQRQIRIYLDGLARAGIP
jgi:TolB-like protein